MARKARTSDDFDSPWKDVLHVYLTFFLAFFFPDIHADVDWSRGYEALDKEFQKIARRAKVGKRLADKLFKVWLKDGSEHWLLIHVEVQGAYEKRFPNRMFDYNSAARQLYNKDVVSLAALCDDRPDWRPTTFGYGRWGCRMRLKFRIAKLLDYAEDVAALEASDNPFAAVVLAHCKTIETRNDPSSRRKWKLRVVKGLLKRDWSIEDVRKLFRALDWIMALPDELEEAFRIDLDRIEVEENKVEYMSCVERFGYERGKEEGKKEGLEKGLEKGERKGLLKGIALVLDAKFGAEGSKLLRKVRVLQEVAALLRFMRFLKTAASANEVGAYLDEESQ